MRTTARSKIKIFDFDHAQFAFARRLFSQGQTGGFCRAHLSNRDRTALPNDLIGEIDCLLDSFVRGIFERHVDLTFVFKYAKTQRWRVEQLDESRRENVLARMLLQMIQASQPIDFAVDRVAHLRHRSLNNMQDTIVLRVDAINYASISKRARVCGLPTARRIECGTIQRDCDLTIVELTQTDDARVEFEET
jgi:hypothetical protein